jgi:hypothetical protein
MKAHPSAQPLSVLRLCYAEGCERTIRQYTFMCDFHWKMLPSALQMELSDAYIVGQDDDESMPTMIYLDAAMRCISFVALKERNRQ